jgi:hypothetical protein
MEIGWALYPLAHRRFVKKKYIPARKAWKYKSKAVNRRTTHNMMPQKTRTQGKTKIYKILPTKLKIEQQKSHITPEWTHVLWNGGLVVPVQYVRNRHRVTFYNSQILCSDLNRESIRCWAKQAFHIWNLKQFIWN